MGKPQAKHATAAENLPAWKKLLFALFLVGAFFAGLELILAAVGVRPPLVASDPFVGFAQHIPLFVEEREADGRVMMVTAKHKQSFFNLQRFPKQKSTATYRIFCMGGSTTYGNPYTDSTSFCGWLRVFLAAADPSRKWEVINAGGISYASYREAALMEELAQYQPDLYIIHTGHNEFLEKRSYGRLADLPAPLLELGGRFAHTRLYTVLEKVLRPSDDKKTQLSGEVNEILNHSIGPKDYVRDDGLARQIMTHFRLNLGRMTKIARAAGAEAMFVVPAINLREISPFKSQHRDGISEADKQRWQSEFDRGIALSARTDHTGAAAAFRAAVGIDDRHAETWFRLGQALFALKRYDEARLAFERASDEDVCPLRALTPMQHAVAEEAHRHNAPVIDYASLVNGWSRSEYGHAVLGKEYFLDHVHPTIDGNRRLALALLDQLVASGIARPDAGWGEARIAELTRQVEGGLDRKTHAKAIRHLGRLFDWAGKLDESYAFLLQANEMFGEEDKETWMLLAKSADRRGHPREAITFSRRLLRTWPDDPEAHKLLANLLKQQGASEEKRLQQYQDWIRARPGDARAHLMLGTAFVTLGRSGEARNEFNEALRLNPDMIEAQEQLANLLANLQGGQQDAEATAEYRAMLRRTPDNPEAHYNLGVVLARGGHSEEAFGHWREALRLNPSLVDARIALADTLADAGRQEDALAQYEEALKLAPNSAEIHNNLGGLLARQGQLAAAISHFSEAVRIQPDFADAHHNLGTALGQQGDVERSQSHLARAQQLRKNNGLSSP